MSTSLYNLLNQYKVVIPIVQRDYAQGREIGKVPKIRERFLRALFEALEKNDYPLELDFIYGYVKDKKKFIPLDGQQRLTTLFLLHWYIAAKENHLENEKNVLFNFTYETRHSSRVFCNKLVEFIPDEFDTPIKEKIINQPWFFTAWENDPTISSMLVMLNAIQKKVNEYGIKNAWALLTSDQPKILFHLLPMEDLGLPDDLYIKMNSRGKELTEFEYFKSQFTDILSPDHLEIFNKKIDQEWSDLFWELYKGEEDSDIAKLVDNGFLRFFHYITDMLTFLTNKEVKYSTNKNDLNNYNLIYEYRENVDYLFSCLDILAEEYKNPILFDSLFYINETEFSESKTRLFFLNPKTDLVKKCADNYDPLLRTNPFSIGEQLLLYACLEHLRNNNNDIHFNVRKLRNLINNSDDTVRKENMPSLLNEVSSLINDGKVNNDSKFNRRQENEENIKLNFIQNNPLAKEFIYRLEDHHLLQGCLAVFEINNDINDYAEIFIHIFNNNCDYDLISRALLCLGDYSQRHGSRWRFGNQKNSVWRELLTPSQRRTGFDKTKVVLNDLLSLLIKSPQLNLEDMIDNYLSEYEKNKEKPKDFRYYFIKYPGFRKNEEGYYYWKYKNKKYECIMMRRTTLGGYHWSPFLYSINLNFDQNVSLDNYGAPLVIVKGNVAFKLYNIDEGYKIEPYEDNDDSKTLCLNIKHNDFVNSKGIYEITQNTENFDIEDRIDKGVELVSKIISF